MGLAPYGEPRAMGEMRSIVKLEGDGTFRLNLEFSRRHREKIDYQWDNGAPVVGELFSRALEELLGPARRQGDDIVQRHRDIARSVQATYEEAFFHLLNPLHESNRVTALALAGGCGMNSVADGKVDRNTPFKRLYVQSAAGGGGGGGG